MMDRYHELEDKLLEKAAYIDASAVKETPSLFDQRKWLGRIMAWVMRDEQFKIRLFRFIDVLPSLKSDEMVLRLLNEYFSDELEAPLIIRRGIERISKSTVPSFAAARIVRAGVERLASQFIAGRDPVDALVPIKALMKRNFRCSVDLLGEVVVSEHEAQAYAMRYLDLLDTIHENLRDHEEAGTEGPTTPGASVSLKISSFYSQLDPIDWEGSIEKTKNALIPVFKKAAQKRIGVTLDMEHYLYKDISIAVFKEIVEELGDSPFAGITLQTYLKESREDLLDLIEWAGEKKKRITVRLVKGAYWDHEIIFNRQKGWPVPVFLQKEDTDRNYEELTRLLFENSAIVYPAIASHNLRSLSHAAAVAGMLGLGNDAFEFQFLNGMAEPLRNALRELDYRVTVYTPVGEFIPGMAYLIRRLLENTANESFLRKSFFEKRSFAELTRSPELTGNDAHTKEDDEHPFSNELPLDFSKSLNREKMRYAMEKVKRDFGRRYPLSLGGREISTDREILSLNPASPEEVVGRVSSASKENAGEAVSEARKAWADWRNTSPEHRAIVLLRAAHELRKKRLELAALQVYEVGKTWREADGDVAEAIDYCEYYSLEIRKLWTTRTLGDYPGESNEYFYEPRGVGVVISPWNFPLAIPTGMISAALVTGNCVIFKPSGLSPVVGWNIVSAFLSSGLPEGVLQFLPGPGDEVGEYLVSHPDIDFVAFTGSKDVGLRIVRLAGETVPGQRNVKKVVAEMGGKNAVIIDETADLDEAVKGVLESALGYQGQKCSACSRVIIVGDVFDEFVGRLKDAMESILIGPAEDPANFMGPLVDKAALEKTMRYRELARKEGKTVLIREVQGQGYYIGPSIFSDIDPGSPVAQEEIFGPVLVVLRAKDIGEAIRTANGTPYALTGGLYSRSPANIQKVKSEFRAGNLYINRAITGALVGRQPFGGYGLSGVGSKAGGPDYLLQFVIPKSASENTTRKGFAPGIM